MRLDRGELGFQVAVVVAAASAAALIGAGPGCAHRPAGIRSLEAGAEATARPLAERPSSAR